MRSPFAAKQTLTNSKAITAKLSANVSFAQSIKGLQVQTASGDSDAENQSVDLTQNNQEEQSNADNTPIPIETVEFQGQEPPTDVKINLTNLNANNLPSVIVYSQNGNGWTPSNQETPAGLALLNDTYEGEVNISWGDNYNSSSTDLMEDTNIDSNLAPKAATLNDLPVMQENVIDAESTISDTDVIVEMKQVTINSDMVQRAKQLQEQASQQSPGVLQLLQ